VFYDWNVLAKWYITSCGINYGRLYCWGHNGSGQLEQVIIILNESFEVGEDSDWRDVSLGNLFSCGIKIDNTLLVLG